jgi:hypothetical protein
MVVARFKDLCLDAGDPARLGAFWAGVLDRTWQAKDDGDGLLTGPAAQHTIWVSRVPEAKTVKHRVHLDIYARDLGALRFSIDEPLPAPLVGKLIAVRLQQALSPPERPSPPRR